MGVGPPTFWVRLTNTHMEQMIWETLQLTQYLARANEVGKFNKDSPKSLYTVTMCKYSTPAVTLSIELSFALRIAVSEMLANF